MACVVWNAEKYGMSYNEFVQGVETTNKNTTWLYEMWNELREKYQDKWVAVHEREIVGVEESKDRLMSVLKKKSIPLDETVIRFITPKDIIQIL